MRHHEPLVTNYGGVSLYAIVIIELCTIFFKCDLTLPFTAIGSLHGMLVYTAIGSKHIEDNFLSIDCLVVEDKSQFHIQCRLGFCTSFCLFPQN